MYLKAKGSSGRIARLESPTFMSSPSGDGCNITFAYHMYGASMGTLNVSVVESGSGAETVIWSRSGNQGNRWYRSTVAIPSTLSGKFKVLHVAVRFFYF